MLANPPEPGAPQSHVFRAQGEFHGLTQIAPGDWQQIVQHALPLEPANAAVRLIVITGTVTSGTDTPGTDTPGTDTSGTDTPGTVTPGTVTPSTVSTDKVSTHKAVCNTIEALLVQTDSFGFLRNWDASVAQSLPPLSPANRPDKKKSSVIDSRQQFLRRYLTHRHSWHPPAPLIAEALLRSGYSDLL